MSVVVTADERDKSRHLFTFDVSRQGLMHSLEPRLRKTCGAHLQLLALVNRMMLHFVLPGSTIR
jgi:hypothetical protein